MAPRPEGCGETAPPRAGPNPWGWAIAAFLAVPAVVVWVAPDCLRLIGIRPELLEQG